MRFFHEDDVLNRLSMREAIECLRRAFAAYSRGEAQNQSRRRLKLRTGATLHTLAAAYGGYFGTKVYSTHPRHGAYFTVLLYDEGTARPVAQFEANHLGQIRTGAASGLAADLLANQGPVQVGLIGSGFQAKTQLEAIRAVREVKSVRVWSRDPAKREGFATKQGAIPVSSAAEAVRDANIVITATMAKDPVFASADAGDAALYLAVGSNYPDRRELPAELVKRSTIVVDDLEQCRIEAGDLVMALDESEWKDIKELKNVAGGTERADLHRPIVFKSVGLGLEDVAVAAYIFEKQT